MAKDNNRNVSRSSPIQCNLLESDILQKDPRFITSTLNFLCNDSFTGEQNQEMDDLMPF